ncbi:energy transducer TonB [Solimonas sp. K1W22B-7]|uniref:energy transducer TonB n=1 Tax=Solimonas sp. K1W22B-7 TaxID=2303331 RepID=UPI0019693477|nr:energy transducer TonB [Solimonas sp. K1W22B-7]
MANSAPIESGGVPLFIADRKHGVPPPPSGPARGKTGGNGGGAGAAGFQLSIFRFIPAMVLACVAMFGLFWTLHALISGTTGAGGTSEILPTVDFLRLAKNFEIETRERKPPEMPDRPEAPPEVPVQSQQIQGPVNNNIAINMSLENTTQVKANFGLSSTDGEYLPIVKVAPMYPARAQTQGIEGWVLLKFTVTEAGTVVDPVVLESSPPGVFDEAAKKAVTKFKYKPRVESGRPIAVPNVQHLIRFELDKK